MKVLLIDPPFERLIGMRYDWYSLGLGFLSAVTKQRGHEVLIYEGEHDANISYREHTLYIRDNYKRYIESLEDDNMPIWNEVEEVITEYQPDVVGISIICVKLESALKIAEICNKNNSEIIVVAGGHHPTALPEEVLANRNIDYVIRGEGEKAFPELLESIENKKSIESLGDIRGLSYKIEGKVIHNRPVNVIDDLDSLPYPDISSLYMHDSYNSSQLCTIMASRGCPYNCGYCASKNMWHGKVRFRSVINVIEEIEHLMGTYNINHFVFQDDCFTLNKNWLCKFCGLIKEKGLKITWNCLSSASLIDEEIVRLLKEAGCIKINVGLETASSRILKLANKKTTTEMVTGIVNLLRKYGIFTAVYVIIGFPTETVEEMRNTQRFVLNLKPDWIYGNIFTPYPGTSLYNFCLENNIINNKLRFSLYSHQSQYNNFTGRVPDEEFRIVSKEILDSFVRYNKKISHLVKRGLRKNYLMNPKSLFIDLQKAYNWYLG
jgi:radical SAM superfamily enzyme YgiQ (UPF0313 family)